MSFLFLPHKSLIWRNDSAIMLSKPFISGILPQSSAQITLKNIPQNSSQKSPINTLQFFYTVQVFFICTNQIVVLHISTFPIFTYSLIHLIIIIFLIHQSTMLPYHRSTILTEYHEIRVYQSPTNHEFRFIHVNEIFFFKKIADKSFRFRSGHDSIICFIAQEFPIIRIM